MDGHLLLRLARKNRLAIQYTALTLAILAVLGVLVRMNIFDGVTGSVNAAMDVLARHGKLGMFVIGLFSNLTLVILLPYNLPMVSLVIYARSVWEVMALGAATGLGAGIGATISFKVANSLVMHVEDLEESALVRLIQRTIERHPHTIPVFVALGTGTPVPDFTIIVPLAMINYPWKKMIFPMLVGKVLQNTIIALLFRYAADSASHLVAKNVNFDVTAVLLVIFVMVVFYQIARSRAARKDPHAARELGIDATAPVAD